MSLKPETPMRLRLDGKKATAKDFAVKVAQLFLGNEAKGIEPLRTMEIMTKLGFKDKKSIQALKKLAIQLELIELDERGEPIKPKVSTLHSFQRFNKKHEFTSNEYVLSWQKDLLTRKDGAPLTTWKPLMGRFEAICNTLKTNPEQWVSGNNINDILEQGRIYMREFMEYYKKREAKISYASNWRLAAIDIQSVRYAYAKAARDFMGSFNYKYPDGEKGIMAQSITQFHGNFSDVRLTTDEIKKADTWLKKNYGIDSDVFRCFWFGIESCSRNKAIWNVTTNYTTHVSKKTGVVTYIMEVFESKTKQIRGGKWVKYCKNKDLQKSIDLVKSRGSDFLIENRQTNNAFTITVGGILKELWKFLGKEFVHLAIPEEKSTGYFMNHAIHALRHIGAHFHLQKSKYHYGYVAKIGGWNKIDELKDSYGEMPPEIVLDLMEAEKLDEFN